MTLAAALSVALIAAIDVPPAAVTERDARPAVAPRAAATPIATTLPPPRALEQPVPGRADFAGAHASTDARQVADWAARGGDAGGLPFLIVDKKRARLFAFDAHGRSAGAAPILLGRARGDVSLPDIGTRTLAQILPHQRTTAAGRYLAEAGRNLQGEDIVWLDYDAGLSMHRVRAAKPSERRVQRLASRSVADNRISYGCINVPAAFYERIVQPTVRAQGRAVVYVLPETRSLKAVFGPMRSAPTAVARADHVTGDPGLLKGGPAVSAR